MTDLFDPLTMGALELDHRVVMAPLTRTRALAPAFAPTGMMEQYYGQRASRGGLIITEATQISQAARGGPDTPGIYTDEQQAGWARVADAIHAKGGKVFLQLWHMGRISHPAYQPDGGAPWAPSAVAARLEVTLPDRSRAPAPLPREVPAAAIPDLVQSYVDAARRAIAAGMDGVEIHAANGYLLEQFLQSNTNHRSDAYGGTIENRCRLVVEIASALSQAIGSLRVAIRLSPYGIANDSGEDDPLPLYSHLVRALDPMGLAYLHLVEPRASGAGQKEVDHQGLPSAAETFRPMWHGVLIIAGNFGRDSARAVVAAGHADAVAFGRFFISNPDLPQRLRTGADLTPYDRSTFYAPGPKGYIDYPPMGG